ncbi:effector binding domain-containing protein [Heyndrickxia vini]|uniref:Effector binding domain-containing protein n=1 Tax=Heyndrickxia vini TaxID=1476025 RepID=A0ABX7E2H0_9BACI|nr:effector binding domain-containing protein [Heyndrickxia vini]QQZ09707.1 effector binding domain-containing protein [Heyndrickxia vini]
MNQVFCQSCGMPITEDSLFGTESNGQKGVDYCIYCYEGGAFKQPNLTMDEMIGICVPYMVENGMEKEEALSILQKTMPFLKRWRDEKELVQPIFKTLDGFTFVGICTRTNNANEAKPNGKIPMAWSKYYGQGVAGKIPNQLNSNETIALYSDYESDVTGDYDFSIGIMVEHVEEIPDGLVTKTVPASHYAVFTTKVGKITDIVPMAWLDIWKWFETTGVRRMYSGDFEIYDERCSDPDFSQVDIYIAIQR